MRALFTRLAYAVLRPTVAAHLRAFSRQQHHSLLELEAKQLAALRGLLAHAQATVPFYRELFPKIGFLPENLKSLRDLERIPPVTKQEMKRDPEKFHSLRPGRFLTNTTGGSTGVPLRYRMSRACYDRGVALLYRGWGLGGFQLGDSICILGGGSLISREFGFAARVKSLATNRITLSSYGVDLEGWEQYIQIIRTRKPPFLRGYASSLYLMAKHIAKQKESLGYRPKAIFTTSELLMPGQRALIERIFGCRVFDGYGLNDGGLSAYECSAHQGLHVDFERAILEVVDHNNRPTIGLSGRILATSLFNYAMPFIRYDTGDVGVLSATKCPCGIQRPLLTQLQGRTADILNVNGHTISGPQLTVLLGKHDLEWYQIIQEDASRLLLRIVPGQSFERSQLKVIQESLALHVGHIDMKVEMLTEAPFATNKHRFIIGLDGARN